MTWSHPGNACAIREIAMIRLMAAASYIQMIYKWGRKPGTNNQEDMIANLDSMTNDIPGHLLRLPINPRSKLQSDGKLVTPSPAQLKAQLYALNDKYLKLQAKARQKAQTDQIVEISESLMKAFTTVTAQAIDTSTDPVQQMIRSGELKVELLSTTKERCRKAGGWWSDTKGCVPAGTAGASPLGGGGVLPILAIAGAGLLLMKLLK
jgi:hypothetical protein